MVEMTRHTLPVFKYNLIPILPIRKARGFLKGIETTLERDTDRARLTF